MNINKKRKTEYCCPAVERLKKLSQIDRDSTADQILICWLRQLQFCMLIYWALAVEQNKAAILSKLYSEDTSTADDDNNAA